jgi:phosphoribosylaminoimidazolecarboxamide formyltransferase/IMP cyclohydrolase
MVSVSDKSQLEVFAPRLAEICPGLRFYATGGTQAFLKEALGEAAPQRVVEITRYSTRPVTHSGLARTTDFKLYLGLLADPHNKVHVTDVSAAGAVFFDMVVSNMLPFPDVGAEGSLDPEETRLRIDIGGPGMVRAGVRNFVRVAVVVDPADYDEVLARVKELEGHTDLAMRLKLARKAFSITSENDEKIVRFFESLNPDKVRAAYEKSE